MQYIKTRALPICNGVRYARQIISDLIFAKNGSSSRPTPNLVRQRKDRAESVSKMSKVPSKEELKARLSPIQFQVTQLKATER